MLTRRVALLASLALPAAARAATAPNEPIRLGTLTPLTGAGGTYGPAMVKVARAAVDDINTAGGVLGRKLTLISEDSETNPDAGVRGARKLIDVNKVCAILGTWASAVTTAVAPLCWQSKTMLFTVSGATRSPSCRITAISSAPSRIPICKAAGRGNSCSHGHEADVRALGPGAVRRGQLSSSPKC